MSYLIKNWVKKFKLVTLRESNDRAKRSKSSRKHLYHI